MKILVSNDDGIGARGILELANALKKIGDVTVVAPLTEQSAVGHAISMKNPLRVTEHYINGEFFGYAVSGTPADCVKMGIRNILKEKPDIVVSGINHGSNVAVNIIYSGTVSAAREATFMDIPSIAMSITSHTPEFFDPATDIAKQLVQKVVKEGLEKGTMLNVNVPNISEVKGNKITTPGNSTWDDYYEERTDPYGNKYYWLKGTLGNGRLDEDSDEFAIENDFISITPVHFDLTDRNTFNNLKTWDLE